MKKGTSRANYFIIKNFTDDKKNARQKEVFTVVKTVIKKREKWKI